MSLTTLGQAIATGLANGAFYAFLTVGFAVMLGLARGLNLAHGELVVLGGYVGYSAARALGWPPLAVLPLAALALAPLGLAWRALLGRVREPVELNSLALTFGLSLLLQNAMLATWSADYRLLVSDADLAAVPGFLGLAPGRALAGGIGLATILGLDALLRHTTWGAALRAVSRDAQTAALMGVNTDRVTAASFAVAAALAGAGGVLFAGFHYLHPAAGTELTLLAITLAILGGVGRLRGLLLGGLAVGLVESMALTWAGPRWRELVVAMLLLGVLLARSRGVVTGREHP